MLMSGSGTSDSTARGAPGLPGVHCRTATAHPGAAALAPLSLGPRLCARRICRSGAEISCRSGFMQFKELFDGIRVCKRCGGEPKHRCGAAVPARSNINLTAALHFQLQAGHAPDV